MLRTLARQDIGGYRKEWLHARAARWSKLDSKGYERLIQLIRLCVKGESSPARGRDTRRRRTGTSGNS